MVAIDLINTQTLSYETITLAVVLAIVAVAVVVITSYFVGDTPKKL